MNLKKQRRKIEIAFVFVAVFTMFGTIAFQTVSAEETTDRFKAKVTADDDVYTDEGRENMANPQNMTANKDVWEKEMGDDMPEGVYRGPLFEPSKMEVDYTPRWRNEYNHGADETSGEFGFTNLIQTVEVGSDKIMNGASEFWMQVPVDKDSLYEFSISHTSSDSNDWYRKSNYFSSVHIFEGEVTNIKSNFTTQTRTLQYVEGERNGEKVTPDMYSLITPDNYYGERPYVKFNGFFESDQKYTVVYNLLTKDEKPQIYTTASDNFGEAKIQYCEEGVKGTDLWISDAKRILFENFKEDDDVMERASIIHFDGSKYLDIEEDKLNIHLATSFIFTSGVGENYMFGEKVQMEKGEVLQFYPDIDWTEYNSSVDNYVSFYLPFISGNGLGSGAKMINLSVANENSNNNQKTGNLGWKFSDFILFTFPRDFDYEEGKNNETTIQIEFKEATEITLLMSAEEYKYNVASKNKRQMRFHNSRMFKIDPSVLSQYTDSESIYRYKDYYTGGDYEPYFYHPYIKAEITEGKWAQRHTEYAQYEEAYSHAFGVHEYYSNLNLTIRKKDGARVELHIDGDGNVEEEGVWESTVEAGKMAWDGTKWVGGVVVGGVGGGITGDSDTNVVGEALKKVANFIKKGLKKIWEGAKTLVATIWDGLKGIYNKIKDFLTTIYTKIMEFVDWLTKGLKDLISILGTIGKRIAMMGGFILFIGVATATSKVIQLADWNKMEGN